MPRLTASDPLPCCPARVLVAGASGAGKTTLAVRIGQVLQTPHTELDGLFHGPDWTPRDTFVAEVRALADGPAWVTEWQYSAVRDLLAGRADLLVWLDVPRGTVLRQVICRTLRRRLLREVLWNANIEPPLRTFLTNRDHIVRWAWRTHAVTGERVRALEQRTPDLVVVRLTDRDDSADWLAGPLRRAAGR